MKKETLVIHPTDITTTFLADIYKGKDYTVLNDAENINAHEVNKMINDTDRVIMSGHGCGFGLFGGNRGTIINDSSAKYLRRTENIFIWCNADDYVEANNLRGLSTSMFISEIGEASMMGIPGTNQKQIDRSNFLFSRIINKYIDKGDLEFLYYMLKREYRVVGCPVVDYNRQGIKLYK